jgi:anti-sigma B factor antagonist
MARPDRRAVARGVSVPVENHGLRFGALVERRGRLVVLGLLGELDIAAREEASRAFEETIKSAPGGVLVNVEGLSFMDLTGVHCFLEAKTLADAAGTRLAVLHGSGPAHRVLALTRIDEVIEMVDDLGNLDPLVSRARRRAAGVGEGGSKTGTS